MIDLTDDKWDVFANNGTKRLGSWKYRLYLWHWVTFFLLKQITFVDLFARTIFVFLTVPSFMFSQEKYYTKSGNTSGFGPDDWEHSLSDRCIEKCQWCNQQCPLTSILIKCPLLQMCKMSGQKYYDCLCSPSCFMSDKTDIHTSTTIICPCIWELAYVSAIVN